MTVFASHRLRRKSDKGKPIALTMEPESPARFLPQIPAFAVLKKQTPQPYNVLF